LQIQAERLGDEDWGIILDARAALRRAGDAGIAAVIWGLSHADVRVRRGCAGFLDHHATDACVVPLRRLALHDPAPTVRRTAVHAVTCQRCKPAPLMGDLVGLLLQVALSDPNWHVRDEAIGGLRHQPPDPRAVTALERILRTETDPRLRSQAHHALKRHDPAYKAAVDARAREQGMAAARDKHRSRGVAS
jgi:hypothetical protein